MGNNRITLAEYAALIGRDRSSVLKKAQNGDFPSARRETIGGYVIWTIDKNEPYTDNRKMKRPRD
ncbi:MAG TPA: hypothetical protein PKJ47_13755 [Candidatus Limiplasma sp.]|nr:hypothetical protein [Candidatus Limiplasma sp.]